MFNVTPGRSEKDDNVHFHLSLRAERPIEGCELSPHPYLKVKGGNLDNSMRAKLLDSTTHYFTYKWFRGPHRPICAYLGCPRKDTFDPNNWSRFALGGPNLICQYCDRVGIPRHKTIFCSTSCFSLAWKEHSVLHSSILEVKPKSEFIIKDKENDHETELYDETTGKGYIEGRRLNSLIEISDNNESENWVSICSESCYKPTIDDVGCCLKIECRAVQSKDSTLLTEPVVIFTEPVLSAPKVPHTKRPLITIPGGPVSGTRIRILTYNILAEVYATRQTYPYCDAWSLSWPYRRILLLQEMEESQADVLCLQEVQADYFESQLLPAMTANGYDGLFKQKTRESMGQHGKVDGCAVFWKVSKVNMIENYSIEFNNCARIYSAQLGLEDNDHNRLVHRLSKDNIAQVLVFDTGSRNSNSSTAVGSSGRTRHSSANSQLFCVVNTHLFSNPKLSDVKLWQTLTLLQEVEAFLLHRDMPLLLCGDFNSEPNSAVYQLMSTGSVSNDHADVTGLSKLFSEPELFVHSIELASSMVTGTGSEPLYTNYTAGFKGTLDYIWYTPNKLRVLAVTAVPDEATLKATGEGLPNVAYPSDHVMLCCDVALSNTASDRDREQNNQQGQGQGQQGRKANAMQNVSGGSSGSSSAKISKNTANTPTTARQISR